MGIHLLSYGVEMNGITQLANLLGSLADLWYKRYGGNGIRPAGGADMGITSASDVADYIVRSFHESGEPISNLKLQKLLYYCQAWFLVNHGRPLFDERIKAWVHGPVVPQVYHEFKDATWQPIEAPTGEPAILPDEATAHVEEVLSVYGPLTAYHLERLTHQEIPWLEARVGLPADAQSDKEISLDTMLTFYTQMSERGKT